MTQDAVFTKIQINKRYLAERRFLYAIVDQDNLRNRHPQLFKKMYDMTYSFTYRMSTSSLQGDVIYYDSIDDVMEASDQWDIIIIQNVGNFIRINSFFEELNNYCQANPDFFLMAFTLDWQAEKGVGWVEIHNQMMVINPAQWRQLGNPKFGGWETVEEQLPNYSRSEENFHDRYTPYWMKGQPGTSLQTRSYPGWGFLKAAFEHGLQIDNFTHTMRECRLYVYPIHESDTFYTALTTNNWSSLTNPNQRKLLERWFNPKRRIWIFNSEAYTFNLPLAGCDTYFGPAAGFKYLDMLIYNPDVKFVFYDYSEESVEWLKNLKDNWDGNDLLSYLKKQPIEIKRMYKSINGSQEENIELLMKEFGGEDRFKKLWNDFRQAPAEFVTCNLFDLEQTRALLAKTVKDRPFFYYSNIFSTDFTSMKYSVEDLEQMYKKFLDLIVVSYAKSTTFGSDPMGKFVYRRGNREMVKL
jgi:hypothetical protein